MRLVITYKSIENNRTGLVEAIARREFTFPIKYNYKSQILTSGFDSSAVHEVILLN